MGGTFKGSVELKIHFFCIWIHSEAFPGLRNFFCGFRKNLIFFSVSTSRTGHPVRGWNWCIPNLNYPNEHEQEFNILLADIRNGINPSTLLGIINKLTTMVKK